MATIKKYNGSTWENAVVRKYGTASEIITPPTTIYTNGQPISTYSIKGNTVQNGTPTPSSPISVNGVGNKTANLFNKSAATDNSRVLYTTGEVGSLTGVDVSDYIPIESGEKYTLNIFDSTLTSKTGQLFALYDNTKIFVDTGAHAVTVGQTVYSFTVPSGCAYIRFNSLMTAKDNVMFVKGDYTAQTFPSYEPYGYKIPISSAGQTTPVYLGEAETTRNIYKLVLTGQESFWSDDGTVDTRSRYRILPTGADTVLRGNRYDLYCTHFKTDLQVSANSVLIYNGTIGVFIYFYVLTADYPTLADFKTYVQQQDANGTPITLYYILATPQTATVNEPLMKIGDYADTLSNATAIPTIEGANSITVDTTVQPSEFTATWTGWHDSSVKEYDGTDWQ